MAFLAETGRRRRDGKRTYSGYHSGKPAPAPLVLVGNRHMADDVGTLYPANTRTRASLPPCGLTHEAATLSNNMSDGGVAFIRPAFFRF